RQLRPVGRAAVADGSAGMSTQAVWSLDEQEILVFEDVNTGSVRVQHHHVDEFDADEDFGVTIGEFPLEALQRALIPPVPLTEHAANKRANPLAWFRRRKTA